MSYEILDTIQIQLKRFTKSGAVSEDIERCVGEWVDTFHKLEKSETDLDDICDFHVKPTLSSLHHIKDQEDHKRVCHTLLKTTLQEHLARRCFSDALTERDNCESPDEAAKWLVVAEIMLDVAGAYVVPIAERHSDGLNNLWQNNSTALHIAASHSCDTLMSAVLDKTEQMHGSDKEGLKRAVLWENVDGKTALAHLINSRNVSQKKVDCMKILVRAEDGFLSCSWGPAQRYPLHDLICLTLNESHRMLNSQLEEAKGLFKKAVETLIDVNPVQSLTVQCGSLKLTRYGKQANLSSLPPYTMAKRALSVFGDIPVLRAICDAIHTLMYQKLDSNEFTLASHGDESSENKINTLNLSDFDFHGPNFRQNNLAIFVENFKPPFSLELAEILLRVRLPDMDRERPLQVLRGIRGLARSLEEFGVKKIVRLVAKLSPDDPMVDEAMKSLITRFFVEELDWEKYDLDTTFLNDNSSLRNLALYSTGHLGVLHHWTGREGIVKIPKLQKVSITIIDKSAVAQPRELTSAEIETARQISERLHALPDQINARLENLYEGTNLIEKFQVQGGIPSSTNIIEPTTNIKPIPERFFEAFKPVWKAIKTKAGVQSLRAKKLDSFRTKIAIIDNGIDISHPNISWNVAKGESLLEMDKGWPLPWFTALDAHGTHMAELIAHIDPCCKLYIYRITSLPTNATPLHLAIKAIQLAVQEKVDIINLSWSFNESSAALSILRAELQKAASEMPDQAPTLIFASKSDEPYAGNIYPADDDSTISVAAATARGRIGTEASKPPDLLVLGENIPSSGPYYMNSAIGDGDGDGSKTQDQVSGSSVATALTSGMASLLLMLARQRHPNHWEVLKRKTAMKGLFDSFQFDLDASPPTYVNPVHMFASPGESGMLGIKLKHAIEDSVLKKRLGKPAF